MRAAVITGASSGIGAEFAYALAREGYDLFLIARRAERLDGVAAHARKLGAAHLSTIPADLADRATLRYVHSRIEASGAEIALLVNNAGFGTSGYFASLPLDRELAELDLNVGAVMALTRMFLPAMIKAGRGTVINVASTAAFQPMPFMATYAASKAFLLSFSVAINQELAGTGVHVMTLCPGLTRTEFQQVAGTERRRLPRFLYMDAATVVAQALKAARRGRTIYVNGRFNALGTQLVRLAPRTLVARVGGRLFRE